MQRLLDATGEIIHRDGVDGLRVSRIAQQAGLDKKQIYYHFGGLDNLVKTYLIGQE